MNLAVPALAASLVAFAVTGSAHAFCRSNACNPARGDDCFLENGCPAGGPSLFRTSNCVTFSVQRDGSPLNGIDAPTFESVITTAFQSWMSADCGGGKHPSINVTSLGQIECNNAEYNQDQGNANIYLFIDDEWPHQPSAIALTTTSHNWKTGEIYDADVEMNGTDGGITNTEPEDGADLPSIITHESGHFLGLEHSNAGETTMRPNYVAGVDNLRSLTQDDIDGICAVYPPEQQAATDDCTPRHGFSSTCRKDPGCDCATTPGRPSHGAGWLLLGVAGLGAFTRRLRGSARAGRPRGSARDPRPRPDSES